MIFSRRSLVLPLAAACLAPFVPFPRPFNDELWRDKYIYICKALLAELDSTGSDREARTDRSMYYARYAIDCRISAALEDYYKEAGWAV